MVQYLPPRCCVLEQDTLLPESTGNTQEGVASSCHDSKIVEWDVKHQHKQNLIETDSSKFLVHFFQ